MQPGRRMVFRQKEDHENARVYLSCRFNSGVGICRCYTDSGGDFRKRRRARYFAGLVDIISGHCRRLSLAGSLWWLYQRLDTLHPDCPGAESPTIQFSNRMGKSTAAFTGWSNRFGYCRSGDPEVPGFSGASEFNRRRRDGCRYAPRPWQRYRRRSRPGSSVPRSSRRRGSGAAGRRP